MVLPGGEENKADRLTDEAAEVIAGGVGGYAAECVAVDGGDAVVEPRKAADLLEVTRSDGTGDSSTLSVPFLALMVSRIAVALDQLEGVSVMMIWTGYTCLRLDRSN